MSLNISAVNYNYTFFSVTFQYFSHLHTFLYSMSLIFHNKSRHYTEDVCRLEVMQHVHYVTGEHVTPPATYKYLQSVRCAQNHRTPNMTYTPLLFLYLAFVAATGFSLQDSQSCKYLFYHCLSSVCVYCSVLFVYIW